MRENFRKPERLRKKILYSLNIENQNISCHRYNQVSLLACIVCTYLCLCPAPYSISHFFLWQSLGNIPFNVKH